MFLLLLCTLYQISSQIWIIVSIAIIEKVRSKFTKLWKECVSKEWAKVVQPILRWTHFYFDQIWICALKKVPTDFWEGCTNIIVHVFWLFSFFLIAYAFKYKHVRCYVPPPIARRKAKSKTANIIIQLIISSTSTHDGGGFAKRLLWCCQKFKHSPLKSFSPRFLLLFIMVTTSNLIKINHFHKKKTSMA